MRSVLLILAASLVAVPAWAAPGVWQWEPVDMSDMQAMTGPQLSSHIGEWVYAADGSIVGSLEMLNGDEASVHVSAFFRPGNQPVEVPVRDLGVVHGKLVVHDTSFAQLAQ